MVPQYVLVALTVVALVNLATGNSESVQLTEKRHFDYDDQLAIESSDHASYVPAINPERDWNHQDPSNIPPWNNKLHESTTGSMINRVPVLPAPVPHQHQGDNTVSLIAELALNKRLPELTSSSPLMSEEELPQQELSPQAPASDSRPPETSSKAILQESAPTPLSTLPEIVSTAASVQQEQSSTTIFPKSYLLPDSDSPFTKIPEQVVRQSAPTTTSSPPESTTPHLTQSHQKLVPKFPPTSTSKTKGYAHRDQISSSNQQNRFDSQNFSSITDKIDSFLSGDDQPVTTTNSLIAGNLLPNKRLIYVNSSVVDLNDTSDPTKPCSITIINYIYPKDGGNGDQDQEISIVDHVDKSRGSDPAVRDYLGSTSNTKFVSGIDAHDKTKYFPKKDTTKPKLTSNVARSPPMVKKDMARPVSRVDTDEREKTPTTFSKSRSDLTPANPGDTISQSSIVTSEGTTQTNSVPPETGVTTVRPQSQVPQPTGSGFSTNTIRVASPKQTGQSNYIDPRLISPQRLPVHGQRPAVPTSGNGGYQDPRLPKEEFYTLSATQLSRLFSTYMKLHMQQTDGGPQGDPEDDSFGNMGVASDTSNRQAPPPISLYNGPPSEFERQMAAGIRDGYRGVIQQNRSPPMQQNRPHPMTTQASNFVNAPPGGNRGVPPRGPPPFVATPPFRGPPTLKDFILQAAASQIFNQQMRPTDNRFHFNTQPQRPPPPQFFWNGQQQNNQQNRPREIHYVLRQNEDQDD